MDNIPDNYDIWAANEHEREIRWQREVEEHGLGACAHCGDPVLDYEEYYEINGELIHGDCILDWLEKFKHG